MHQTLRWEAVPRLRGASRPTSRQAACVDTDQHSSVITRAASNELPRRWTFDVRHPDLEAAWEQAERIVQGSGLSADRFVHRHLQVLPDGLRLRPEPSCPGPAITMEDLRQT